ncbi:hypothetical protein Clacol_001514 [Clathrus columnatus]|uniref:Uncharacterized protein n=1 Tax=Clathrus columnatus TaxID=1419009 RepID=A0AAV5A268_9AGAM|nr:hypothetical protein Clacol_001514 [Clathrus columnatus]
MSSNADEKEQQNAIRIAIPREFYVLPGSMMVAGSFLGMFRGGRREGLRYLAENAHRAPTTLQGWYFYNKTKQYRVMLGALKGAGADGMRLGLTAVGWVASEQLLGQVGLDDVREIGAGISTAAFFSIAYRLPWTAARQALFLGLLTGTTMRMLRFGVERAKAYQVDTPIK